MDKFVMIDDTAGTLDSLECVDGCKHNGFLQFHDFQSSVNFNHLLTFIAASEDRKRRSAYMSASIKPKMRD